MDKGVVLELLESLPHLLKLPSKQVWFDFDEEADVLYVSFERPQGATDSEALSAVVGWLAATTCAPPALLKFPSAQSQRA